MAIAVQRTCITMMLHRQSVWELSWLRPNCFWTQPFKFGRRFSLYAHINNIREQPFLSEYEPAPRECEPILSGLPTPKQTGCIANAVQQGPSCCFEIGLERWRSGANR